ncbi:MarR family winged helix-turn-helix transcriptional regulator [Paenibacillus sp. AR247]|uniref:MarR family winged helix-turn-helix transcriptional regulator n=1 Tax=Paenibacillus sp. AR247 TaxID=1631599 RepID=UPI000CF8B034|nr:helix-turn-helix domain-containing protein [Paenibacillus sp. AR247]PQP90457.1 MarR family transcriptional regulator [Paenibacillus sp. AR247]
MTDEHLPKAVYEQLAEFRYRLRKFIHFSENAARDVGLTPQQHQLMLAIQGYPGRDYATIAEAAEKLQITHHACVGLVSRCVRAGLIVRRANPEDARSVHITLTEKGMDCLRRLSTVHLMQLESLDFNFPHL